MKLIPKNWAEFQHYKNRRPSWIKLHKSTLDDYTFQRLPVASRALAPMLWLLASEYPNGVIESELSEIAFRLHRSEEEVSEALKPLIDKKFFSEEQDDSKSLSECKQDAITEKRREEKRREDIPEDSEDIILQVMKLYPKLQHLVDVSELSHAQADALIEALAKDGKHIVISGTKAFADSLDDPKFAPDPVKFFSGFQYRKYASSEPVVVAWRRRSDGKILGAN